MIRRLLVLATACGAACFAAPGTAGAACTRATLQGVVDRYIASQAMGDPQSLPIRSKAPYVEQDEPADLYTGILARTMKIEFHHSLLDIRQCQTFTELGVTDPSHPYVIGTRFAVDEDVITAVHTLVTNAGDGPFSADNWVRVASTEDWGVLLREHRSDRATLIAAANAYLDYFNDKTAHVPWGIPCRRLEGGLLTGTGGPDDSCNVDIPAGVKIVDRSFVVDEQLGAVVAFTSFGQDTLPDTHLFRVVDGTIRNVHTITACRSLRCGFSVPATLPKH
jgi:hypothetical protein